MISEEKASVAISCRSSHKNDWTKRSSELLNSPPHPRSVVHGNRTFPSLLTVSRNENMAAGRGRGRFLVPLSLSFLFVGVNCMSECTKIDDCSCKRSDGQTMSLHPIDSKSGPK